MNVLDRTSFTTFGGNPLSVAAGRATLNSERPRSQSNAAARGRQMNEMLAGYAIQPTGSVSEVKASCKLSNRATREC